jgi:hypothetical protein
MKTVRVVTDIAAPVEHVWAEVIAVGEYAVWNPFITEFRGEVDVGSRAEIRIAPPGGRPMTFRPTITVVEDEKRLEWLGHVLLSGVFDGRHSFELETLGDGRTRLTQAEEFSGWLVPFMSSVLGRTRLGFQAMNEALRLRAERATATDVAP